MQEVVDAEKAGKPVGTREYKSSLPEKDEGWELFYVEFGSVKE